MKCKKCGKELRFGGFENDENGERVDLYSCQTQGCPEKLAQIRVEEEK